MEPDYKKNRFLAGASYLLSSIVWVSAAILLSVNALYFGGDLPSTTVWLNLLSPILWLCFLGVCIIAWIKERWTCDLLDISVMAFVVYAVFSFFLTPTKYTAKQELLWISTYASLFLSLRHTFRHRTGAVNLLVFSLLVAFVVACYGFYNYGQHTYSVWNLHERPDYGIRMSGTFGCPNHFANYLVLSALAASLLTFIPIGPLWVRYLAGFGAIAYSIGVFFSISRGGYIAWVFGIGFVCIIAFRRLRWPSWVKWGIGLGIPALIGISILMSNAVLERLEQRHLEDIRMVLIRDSAVIWEQSPMIGTGMASFAYMHPRVHDASYSTFARYAHNDYMNTLVDYGVIGLLLVMAFLVLVVLDLRRSSLKGRHPTANHEWFNFLGWAVLITASVHAVVDFNFHIPACALLVFALLGLATMKTVHDDNTRARRSWTFLGMGCAVLFFFIMGYFAVTSFLSYRHYKDNEWAIPVATVEEGLRLAEESKELDEYYPVVAENVAESFRQQLIDRYEKSPIPSPQEFEEREKLAEAALFLYERCLRINSLDDGYIVKQAMVYDVVDRFQEAFMLYQQALAKQPFNRFYYRSMGLHYSLMGEFERARDAFQKVASFPVGRKEDEKYKLEAERMAEKLNKLIDERFKRE